MPAPGVAELRCGAEHNDMRHVNHQAGQYSVVSRRQHVQIKAHHWPGLILRAEAALLQRVHRPPRLQQDWASGHLQGQVNACEWHKAGQPSKQATGRHL